MKVLLAVALSLALLSASALNLHAGQYGPAKLAANAGEFSLGAGYFFSEQKFKSPTFNFGGVSVNFADPILRSNQAYAEADYGFTKNLEGYVRIGGTDAKLKDTGFYDNAAMFGTAGVRGVFFRQGELTIGGFAQFNYYSNFRDTIRLQTANMSLKLKNPWDVNVGVIAQHKFRGFDLYYGPVVYWSRAKADADLAGTGAGAGNVGGRDSVDLKEKTNLGAFAGLIVPLTKRLSLTVEGQYKMRVSAGGAVAYTF